MRKFPFVLDFVFVVAIVAGFGALVLAETGAVSASIGHYAYGAVAAGFVAIGVVTALFNRRAVLGLAFIFFALLFGFAYPLYVPVKYATDLVVPLENLVRFIVMGVLAGLTAITAAIGLISLGKK